MRLWGGLSLHPSSLCPQVQMQWFPAHLQLDPGHIAIWFNYCILQRRDKSHLFNSFENRQTSYQMSTGLIQVHASSLASICSRLLGFACPLQGVLCLCDQHERVNKGLHALHCCLHSRCILLGKHLSHASIVTDCHSMKKCHQKDCRYMSRDEQ